MVFFFLCNGILMCVIVFALCVIVFVTGVTGAGPARKGAEHVIKALKVKVTAKQSPHRQVR